MPGQMAYFTLESYWARDETLKRSEGFVWCCRVCDSRVFGQGPAEFSYGVDYTATANRTFILRGWHES